MHDAFFLTGLVILMAFAFDFVNGFHDASNSIATIVATGILKPTQAVVWAAFFNFVAVFMFGTGVATTVGSGMIALNAVTPMVIMCGLIGAIIWELITWWLGLPTSSSHALLGGYAGAAMANSVFHHGVAAVFAPIVSSGWGPTTLFIIIAPMLGLVFAHFLMKALGFLLSKKKTAGKKFGRWQMLSSAFLSLMHGGNDAQKTAGIIAGVLVSSGYNSHFEIPMWVLTLSYLIMALGTLTGGWRIVHTMGHRLTHLEPQSGFCAETAAALSILLATLLRLPVSTTQTTTGAIIGVGAARSAKLVNWKVAQRIFQAWVFTIPVAAALGALAMCIALEIAG